MQLRINDKNFPEKLKEALMQKGMTPPELARMLNIHPSNVNKYMRGITRPRANILKEINTVLFKKEKKYEQPFNVLSAFKKAPPKIDYVLPGMIAGTVGSLVSPGGTGKSLFALQIATQLAGGPDLLNLGSLPTGRVVFCSAEDPIIALKHRLHYLGQHLDIKEHQAIAKKLVIEPLIGENTDLLNPKYWDMLLQKIKGSRLLILDTLRRFHNADENNSGEMAQVISAMERLADSSGCSVLFLHHTNKSSILEGQGDRQQASRGSSVLVDNIRWSSYVAGMAQNEVKKYGIPQADQKYFVRFGITKQNYGPPTPDKWYKRHDGGILLSTTLTEKKKTPYERKKS